MLLYSFLTSCYLYHSVFAYVYHMSVSLCVFVTDYSLLTVVQSLSCDQLFAAPWTATCQASLTFTISQRLFKLMTIEMMMPSNHLILFCPLLFLPSIFPSIRVFSNKSVLHIRWPKINGASASTSALSMNIQG